MARTRATVVGSAARQAILTGAVAFGLAVGMALGSQSVLVRVSLVPALFTLVAIILVGVLFDTIGVAVTAASETPFHAMAAKRTPGARHALRLVRNAPRVASFSNDVVGDIAASLAGAAGAAIVFQLAARRPAADLTVAHTLMVAAISAVTVAGKAYGKGFAIRRANAITHRVGRVLEWLERGTGILLLPEAPARPRIPRASRQAGPRARDPGGPPKAGHRRQRPRQPRRHQPGGGRNDGEPHPRPD